MSHEPWITIFIHFMDVPRRANSTFLITVNGVVACTPISAWTKTLSVVLPEVDMHIFAAGGVLAHAACFPPWSHFDGPIRLLCNSTSQWIPSPAIFRIYSLFFMHLHNIYLLCCSLFITEEGLLHLFSYKQIRLFKLSCKLDCWEPLLSCKQGYRSLARSCLHVHKNTWCHLWLSYKILLAVRRPPQ